MPVTAQLWTVAGLSTELALNAQTVGKIVVKLRPDGAVKGRNAYLMANVVRAMRARAVSIGQERGGLIDARTRLTLARAKAEELKQRELDGELIPAEQIEEAWLMIASNTRTRILAIPRKLAPILAPSRPPGEVEAILTAEVREALTELSMTKVPGLQESQPNGRNSARARRESRRRRKQRVKAEDRAENLTPQTLRS